MKTQKERAIDISFAIAENSRAVLINTVLKWSDEYESKGDLISLSKMSKKELRFLLWNILKYEQEN